MWRALGSARHCNLHSQALQPALGTIALCARLQTTLCNARFGRQLRIISNRMPMSWVVTLLSRYMHALVVDQTGLAGDFEVKLIWTPDDRPIPWAERGSAVFTAVQEQLGLRLVSKKGPMDVLVVDRAEKTPTEN